MGFARFCARHGQGAVAAGDIESVALARPVGFECLVGDRVFAARDRALVFDLGTLAQVFVVFAVLELLVAVYAPEKQLVQSVGHVSVWRVCRLVNLDAVWATFLVFRPEFDAFLAV